MLEYRLLQKLDMPSAKRLWAICFEEITNDFIECYFTNYATKDSFMGAFLDEKLVSVVQIVEYDKEFRGNSVTVGYLTGLCTHPNYRMRGIAKELVKNTFDVLRNRGIAFTRMYPYNYEFCKKIGYAVCSEEQIITIDKEQFSGIETCCIETLKLRKNEFEEYLCELLNCYYGFFSRLSGYIIRDEEAMRNVLQKHIAKEKSEILIVKEKGFISGYVLYLKTDRGIITEEMVFKDLRSFVAISNYLNKESHRVELVMPPHDKLYSNMDDPVGYIQLRPHMMEKIIDITKSLSMLELIGLNKSIYVKITNITKYNSDQIYEITEHGVKIETNNIYWDLECDSSTYMQLITGFIGCSYAMEKGLLIVKNYERLCLFKSILPKKSIYGFEKF